MSFNTGHYLPRKPVKKQLLQGLNDPERALKAQTDNDLKLMHFHSNTANPEPAGTDSGGRHQAPE